MHRLHYSCRTPCTRWRAFASADERASYDSTVLRYIADGCVIIRGIHWLSFGAAILPSGGRGASTGVDHPTAAVFQVHFPGRKRVTGQNQNRLCYSCVKTVLLNKRLSSYAMPKLMSLAVSLKAGCTKMPFFVLDNSNDKWLAIALQNVDNKSTCSLYCR